MRETYPLSLLFEGSCFVGTEEDLNSKATSGRFLAGVVLQKKGIGTTSPCVQKWVGYGDRTPGSTEESARPTVA